MTLFARAAALLVALWSTLALAGPRPDFSGSWRIDDALSQPMEPIFVLQDLSWIQRKAAAGFDVEAEISQQPDRLIVRFDNLTGEHKQELFFDGQPHASVNPAGVATTFTTVWSAEGTTLVASGNFRLDDGTEGTLQERRTLSADGQQMSVVVELGRADGKKASARRTYRRQ